MKLKLGIDKFYHFVAGVFIYLFSVVFLSNIISMIPVVIIAALKEMYDKKTKRGTPDFWDFLFTVLGGLSMFCLTL